MKPQSVLVAEDHPYYLEGLCRWAREVFPEAAVVGVSTQNEARHEIEEREGGLFILDIYLPEDGSPGARAKDSFATLEHAVRRGWRVLAISGSDDPEVSHRAADAGAWGFMPKSRLGEMGVKSYIAFVCDAEFPVFPRETRASAQARRPAPSNAALSDREKQIMDGVAAGLSNKEIAQRTSIEPGTVKNHLRRIFDKLGVSSRTAAVAKLNRRG